MTASDHQARSGFNWPIAVLGTLLIYVVSVGPIAWLDFHNILPDAIGQPLMWLYLPLVFLYDRIELVRVFFDWYVSIFGVPL